MRTLGLLLGVALGMLACRPARLPAEPPLRILDLSRSVAIVLTAPSPLRVFTAGDAAEPQLLGITPLQIDELVITKELWKHSPGQPPPELTSARALSTRGERYAIAIGDPLAWDVLVELEPGRDLLAYRLALEPDALEAAFRRGRVEFQVPTSSRTDALR